MHTQQENGKTSSPEFWKGKTILLTGGAGSLGTELVDQLLKLPVHAIRIFDVSEASLYAALQRFGHNEKLRYHQGDIRDRERLRLELHGVDYVLHLAALKSVDLAALNPVETIETNAIGTITVVEESLHTSVKRVLCLSSDKAIISSPDADVYHATKFLVEKVTLWANSISDSTLYSCVRPANFVESSMNVFQTWHSQLSAGLPLSVTDMDHVRYFMPIRKAAEYTLKALELMKGGEIFVPPATPHRIGELAQRLGVPYTITGTRKGDRAKEDLMTELEMKRAEKIGNMWVLR